MPFAVLALGGLPADDAASPRDPRGGRARRPPRVSSALGRAHRPGGADPQRGALARRWPGSVVAWPASRGLDRRARLAADRRRRRSSPRLVFAPWAIRDWAGLRQPAARARPSPTRCRSTGFDIFAWNDPPTLARYLAVGPARLARDAGRRLRPQPVQRPARCRALPLSLDRARRRCRGRSAAPRSGRSSSCSRLTFLVTSLVFPVATTWGTFLHAAGTGPRAAGRRRPCSPSTRLIARGRRPARLDPAGRLARRRLLAVFGSALFSVALLPSFGDGLARDGRAVRRARPPGWRRPAHPLDATAGPVITDFPIWLAETHADRRAGPARRAAGDVLDLARHVPAPRTRGPASTRRARPLAGDPRRTARPAPRASASSTSASRPSRPSADPLADTPRLRDRLPMRPTRILRGQWSQHAPGRHPTSGTSRFDGLHAEAKAAVGYSANTLRSVRERYREAYAEELGPLAGPARRARRGRARPARVAARGRTTSHGPTTRPSHAAEAGADDARIAGPADRRRRASAVELGDHQAELAKLELAQRTLERDVAVPRARRRDPAHRGGRPGHRRATSRCGSSRPRRRSARDSPRRSTTARPRRSRTRSSRSSTSSGSSTRTRALARTELRFLRELLRRELGDVRTFISQLRPPMLDELGLDGAITDAVEHDARPDRPRRSATELAAPPDAPDRRPADGRPARRCRRPCRMSASTRAATASGRDRDRRTATGSSRSATTAAASTSERWRPAAAATSGSNSCASAPS